MRQDNPRGSGDLLPSRSDFNPWGEGALDAEWAWGNFGGLSLAEAHSKFRECPEIYQEDFMFMGGKAFAFYFPVIEDYLRNLPTEEDEDKERQEWILAKCIQNQFDADTAYHVLHLSGRVVTLSLLIMDNIRLFGYDEEDRQRTTEAWQELKALVESLTG